MLDFSTLVAFVPAVVVVILAPGPDTIYTLTRSLDDGRAAGFVAAVGTATGILVHTAAAVLGLSALLRTSAVAYALVKYAGAVYLVYLGVQTLRSGEEFEIRADREGRDRSLRESYRQAVAINVSNPKVAVFVLAFFPQFVPATASAPLLMALLGLLYAGLGLVYLGGVALFAGRVRHLLADSEPVRRLLQYTSGSVLVGFGLKLALDERPAA